MPEGLRGESGEFMSEDLDLYISTLPRTLIDRLQMTPKGIAGDYVNTFTAPLFACAMANKNLAFVEKHLPKNISVMTSYRDYLVMRVREQNQLTGDLYAQVDEALFVETLMDVPRVVEIDKQVEAVRSFWESSVMGLPEKIAEVKVLLEKGGALVRG
jgi:hypothetical protein